MVDQIANLIVAQLIHLEFEDYDKDISLYINSPGGSVYAGLAIYDTMQYIKPDVISDHLRRDRHVDGRARFTARRGEGKRMALPNAKILIHQVAGGFQGQATDIEIQAREVISLKRRLEEIFAQHTNSRSTRSPRTWGTRLLHDAPQEAQEYKIIDRVVAHRGVKAALAP